MANSGAFQDQIRQLGRQITQFDQFPDGPQKTACKDLVQLVLDLHGAGLERVMEIVFEADAGPSIIDTLAKDAIVSSLLMLYSLHPDDLITRVQKGMEEMRPRLRKLNCSAELVSVKDGRVKIQVTAGGHGCGSSKNEVRAIVEEGVFGVAPDVIALDVMGLEEPPRAGFVALESLLRGGFAMAGSSEHSPGASSAD